MSSGRESEKKTDALIGSAPKGRHAPEPRHPGPPPCPHRGGRKQKDAGFREPFQIRQKCDEMKYADVTPKSHRSKSRGSPPLLPVVKTQELNSLCRGGDKSAINISYPFISALGLEPPQSGIITKKTSLTKKKEPRLIVGPANENSRFHR